MTSVGTVISGPVPAYSNPPIEPQYFQPSRFPISNITLGTTTTVTVTPITINSVTVNANYVIGQLIRLLIPSGYGCTQLNERTGYVISLPTTNQFVVKINSSVNVNSFISAGLSQVPQVVAIGDVNSGQSSTTGSSVLTYIPGSFINISPL